MQNRLILVDSVLLNKNKFIENIPNIDLVEEANNNFHAFNILNMITHINSSISIELYTALNENNKITIKKFMKYFDAAVNSTFSNVICMSLFLNRHSQDELAAYFLDYISVKANNKNKEIFISIPNSNVGFDILYQKYKKLNFIEMNRDIYANIQCDKLVVRSYTNIYKVNISNILIYDNNHGYYFWGGNSLATAYIAALYAKFGKIPIYKHKTNMLYIDSVNFWEFDKSFVRELKDLLDKDENIKFHLLFDKKYMKILSDYINKIEQKLKFKFSEKCFFLEDFYNSKVLYQKIMEV